MAGITETGHVADSLLTEDGEFVIGSLLTEDGEFVFGLAAGIEYTDTPSLTFKILTDLASVAAFSDQPSLIVRFIVHTLKQDLTDVGNMLFILSPNVLDIHGMIADQNITVKFIPASTSGAALVSKPAFTIRLRPDITNGLLFNEVISAVWNESAFVLLNPELLEPIWTAENVLTEGVFGFPGIKNRIQTVRSRITVQ